MRKWFRETPGEVREREGVKGRGGGTQCVCTKGTLPTTRRPNLTPDLPHHGNGKSPERPGLITRLRVCPGSRRGSVRRKRAHSFLASTPPSVRPHLRGLGKPGAHSGIVLCYLSSSMYTFRCPKRHSWGKSSKSLLPLCVRRHLHDASGLMTRQKAGPGEALLTSPYREYSSNNRVCSIQNTQTSGVHRWGSWTITGQTGTNSAMLFRSLLKFVEFISMLKCSAYLKQNIHLIWASL